MPLHWLRLFITPAWGKFRCAHCHALLGIDTRRRLLGMIPWFILVIVLIFVVRLLSYGVFIAIPVLVVVGVVYFVVFFSRAVLLESTGFRCRRCGYDLEGQQDPRCSECGAEFDAQALTRFKRGEAVAQPAPKRLGRVGVAVLIVVISVLVAGQFLGIILWRKARRLAAPTTPAPTTPASNELESPDGRR